MSPPLKGLQLSNYRNFRNKKEVFKFEHTLFKGKNAVGKTNILEAISFLCPGTGFRKDGIKNFIFQKQEKLKSSITFDFDNEDLENHLMEEIIGIILNLFRMMAHGLLLTKYIQIIII